VVLSVPWFEYAEVVSSTQRTEFVAAKLRGAGVRIPPAWS